MVKALFDTNIVIDHLRGVPQSRDEIRRHEDKAISVITWMEVMVGATPTLLDATQSFLEGFRVIDLDKEVAGTCRHVEAQASDQAAGCHCMGLGSGSLDAVGHPGLARFPIR